jgi:glycosyltransferase involved in cell wall biosynthesis
MYNESSIIAQTAETLSSYMENNFTNYEIIFSDDGSLDNSKDIVASLELPHV